MCTLLTLVEEENNLLKHFHEVHVVVAKVLKTKHQSQLGFWILTKGSKESGVVLRRQPINMLMLIVN
jgi:hypothetical protein